MKVEYHPAIESNLREIIKYYNNFSQGLGTEFLNEFEKQISNIVLMPTRWIAIDNDIRRALMKRFPFVIYFRILKNGAVRVTVVKHQRRHPNFGRNRK